ncbi:MAG TPA: 50S ribosomal protein L11 [Candidatus Pacearchaeota archaeon]|jgi:large subunit ribosomal protein L11|nr:50S ribosomal protein L11 [Dehalococcoidia bacterium]HJO14840.1 50S ribosomal protein L11 [Candidatus Pacearchaeota archaeon]|tara:strand:- start:733 stop:1431 length:699 start_codon:yes stop_codon:yes gene_type:complete
MVKINLLIDGGNMKPGPAVAQQLGPMGVNMGKVISDVNEATKEFKGMKVPVELDVDEKTKDFTIHTSSPPTSELLKNELGLEKGSDKHAEVKVGNASIEDMIKIAKIKLPNMLDRDMKAAVKSVLGTSASVGILVENENPNNLIQAVNDGKFDSEINDERTETSPEKREKLNQFFTEIKSEQEAKAAAAAKEAKEAEEAEAKKAEEAEEGTTEEAKPTDTAPPGATPAEEKK